MRQYITQFKCSFSLHSEVFDEPKQVVITDPDNELVFVLYYKGDWVHSIQLGSADENIICVLEGEQAKLNKLAQYLLDIVELSALPRSFFSIHIPAILPTLATKSRKNKISRHTNLGNSNIENITELNVFGPNWNIGMGNNPNEPVPSALTPSPTQGRTRRRRGKN